MHHHDSSFGSFSSTPRSGVNPAMAIAILAFAGLFAAVSFFGLAHSMAQDRLRAAGDSQEPTEAVSEVPALGAPDLEEVLAAAPGESDSAAAVEAVAPADPADDGAEEARPRPSTHRGARDRATPTATETEDARPEPATPRRTGGIAPIGGSDPLEGLFGNGLDA